MPGIWGGVDRIHIIPPRMTSPKRIELYRAVIPRAKIINDNSGQHYRTHQGKLSWISSQFDEIFQRIDHGPGGFQIPSKDFVLGVFPLGEPLTIICEVWRPTNNLFDPQNYSMTFKAPIDLLVHNGYIHDDNWKFVDRIIYQGGGRDAYAPRHISYDGDGLPEEMTIEFWNENASDNADILIRVFIEKESETND